MEKGNNCLQDGLQSESAVTNNGQESRNGRNIWSQPCILVATSSLYTLKRKCVLNTGHEGYSQLSKISLEIAMKHFGIVPILSCGLEMLWEHLSEKFLKTLENIQVTHK